MSNLPQAQPGQRLDVEISDGKLKPSTMFEAQSLAMSILESGLAPQSLNTAPKIFIAICCGAEIGLSPMMAVRSIAVINGKPSIYGDCQLGICSAHKEFEDIIEKYEKDVATCEVKRKGRTPVVREFSEADAQKARLWGKSGPWSQYPKRMLQMRARSWALRDCFSDALGGIPQAEEIRDIEVSERPEIVVDSQSVQPQQAANIEQTLTDEQCMNISNVAMSLHHDGQKATHMCDVLLAPTVHPGATSLRDIPQSQYNQALQMMQSKVSELKETLTKTASQETQENNNGCISIEQSREIFAYVKTKLPTVNAGTFCRKIALELSGQKDAGLRDIYINDYVLAMKMIDAKTQQLALENQREEPIISGQPE